MPKVLLILGMAIGGVIFGMIALLQEHVLPMGDVIGKQMGVWAFIWLLVDRLLQYLLKFKPDKSEKHLEEIKMHNAQQTLILGDVKEGVKELNMVMAGVDGNLKQGLTNQKDIYAKYLREPKKKR